MTSGVCGKIHGPRGEKKKRTLILKTYHTSLLTRTIHFPISTHWTVALVISAIQVELSLRITPYLVDNNNIKSISTKRVRKMSSIL